MKIEARFQLLRVSERAYLLAGAMAITGLGLAIGGVSSSVVVALIAVSASVLLAGLTIQARGLRTALTRLASRVLSSRGGLALAALIIISVTAVGLGRGLPATANQAQTREFEIDAAQFHYSPSIIRVDKGDRVVIKFRATDVSHGMYVDGYDVEVNANPGRTQTLEFVADRAGKYQFRCSQTCGSLHPFMIGWLVVRSNGPFTASLGLVALVVVGTVAFVWFGKGSRDD
jgi:heme/copper-type cytochrome/quinol oxidase subunit 2